MKKTIALFLVVLVLGCTSCIPNSSVEVKNLQLEMKKNPQGIDVLNPRFSWQIFSDMIDLKQVSYHIQVASCPKKLQTGNDLWWDSGVVTSDASVLVPYEGKTLESGKPYFWRVKLVTNQGETAWSEIASWSMALLDKAEWKATWIGEEALSNPGETLAGKDAKVEGNRTRLAARYLRKEFKSEKEVKRAVLYISGLGSHEAYLNGNRVSEDIFAPIPTMYHKRVFYNVYDVTKLLIEDKNTLGVVLGNGRYLGMRNPGIKSFGMPMLLAQLQIQYKDGSQSMVVSDTSWKVSSQGPIIANNEFDGEEYDARREMEGWNKNGFDDSTWKNVDVMPAPKGELVAQQTPNLRIQEEVKPVAIMDRPDGKYVIDMGQNMVGWLAVNLKGKKDQPIKMVFSEMLNEDGSLRLANMRSALVTDIYTPAKDGVFSWEPSFVYHGFRYIEISGLEEKPTIEDFIGKVVYDWMQTTGYVKTSNALVNQIHSNAFWGIRGNYRGMPTDCPQRDERLGWLGDRTTGAYGEAYIFNNANLYNKWMQDIEDSMSPQGSISDVSPNYWTIYSDNVTWPAAFFNVADMLYRHFGDDAAIRKHYQAMKRWMAHMEKTTMKDYIMTKDTYGDWCMPPERQDLIHSEDPSRITAGPILSTTLYYDLLNKMVVFAKICGQEDDILRYKELAAKMKDAYNAKYFNEEKALYDNNTVTANLLSLRLGLVPEGYEKKVFENIVKKTNEDFKGHVSTGVLGIQHLMRGLTEYGRLDMAYKLLTNEDYPSWGYTIKQGATTIWELWNGDTADPAMNSANHVMLLGDVVIWYYEYLSGIKNAPESIAFKKILMEPVFPDGLDEVTTSFLSAYGEIKSAWSKKNGVFSWNITIPGNTTAIVRIPKTFDITVPNMPGIHKISETENYTEIEVGSGNYHFGK